MRWVKRCFGWWIGIGFPWRGHKLCFFSEVAFGGKLITPDQPSSTSALQSTQLVLALICCAFSLHVYSRPSQISGLRAKCIAPNRNKLSRRGAVASRVRTTGTDVLEIHIPMPDAAGGPSRRNLSLSYTHALCAHCTLLNQRRCCESYWRSDEKRATGNSRDALSSKKFLNVDCQLFARAMTLVGFLTSSFTFCVHLFGYVCSWNKVAI